MYNEQLRWKCTQIITVLLLAALLLAGGCMQQSGPEAGSAAQNDESPPAPQVEQPVSTNHTPEIISAPPEESSPGQIFLYQPIAVDADGDSLHWSLEASPAGLLIDPDTGLVFAQTLPGGEHDVSIRVEDGQGGSDSQDFNISIHDGPVIFSTPPEYTLTGTPYRYRLKAADPEGLDLIYAISAGPAGMTIDPDTGELAWNADVMATVDVRLAVSNTLGKSSIQQFSLTVVEPDSILIVSTPVVEAYTTLSFEYQLSLLNGNSPGVTYSFNHAPTGMAIDPGSGLITWTPAIPGTFAVEVVVMNSHGYMDTQNFSVVVNSLESMDQMFDGMIDDLFDSLVSANLAAAMQTLTVDAQQRLGPLFIELLDYMQQVSTNYSDPVRISINSYSAEYMVRRTGDTGDRVFMITFLRDNNRNWKINDL